jgi:hypothetical protein
MLIERIKAHNEVNGFAFSVAEFLLIVLVLTPFGLFYFRHGRLMAGAVVIGIVVNSLVVAGFGVHALMSGQRDIGVLRWFDKDGRAVIASRYPRMTRDTCILTAAALVPFGALLCVVCDSVRSFRKRSREKKKD